VRFVQLDVTSAESVDAAAAHVSTDFGYLDVLVNNAGVSTGSGRHIDHILRPTEETADDLRFVYETNVFAVVGVTNAFPAPLAGRPDHQRHQQARLDRRGGRLGGPAGHGLLQLQDRTERLTVHYARELADTAIKVNGAAPGLVATDFNGFRRTRTPEQGAAVAVRLATLPADGPTGAVFEDGGQLSW
jgi:NAD(P)-dependent dehydrogenase (short-subunit alcohol dehydrogenase family)